MNRDEIRKACDAEDWPLIEMKSWDWVPALLDENEKLREALRRTKGDLLRYGRHDSDCPAREYVLVDGIPTTCDCGLNLALDSARLATAVLGEQEATPECTGLAATWCPVHGDCTCRPYGPGVADHKDDPTCPLHAPSSPHGESVGEQEATPPEPTDGCGIHGADATYVTAMESYCTCASQGEGNTDE